MRCSSAGRQNHFVGVKANNSQRRLFGQRMFLTELGLIKEVKRGVEHFWRKRGITPPPVSQTRIDFNPSLNPQ